MKFTVVGSLNTDLVTSLPKVPKGGQTIHATNFETHYGGKGANQAYALRRLTDPQQVDVAMIGCVGNDTFGTSIYEHLRKNKIDVSQLSVLDDERTGVASILVEASGENRIMVFSGANAAVKPPTNYDGISYVVLQNEIPLETTFNVIKHCRSLNIKSVFNPSPLPKVPLKEWPKVDILVVNEGEAADLTGLRVDSRESAKDALLKLLESSELVVITFGANGVLWQAKDDVQAGFVPAHKVDKIVDTTGAGDTFLAAFLSQMVDPDQSMEQRMSFATKAAAITVTREGAASSIPSLEEVNS